MPQLEDYPREDFSQSEVLSIVYPGRATNARLYSDRTAKGGACWAFSAKWITRHMGNKGESAGVRIAFLKMESNVVDAVQTQMFAFQNVEANTKISNEILALQAKRNQGGTVTRGEVNEIADISKRIQAEGSETYDKALSVYGLTQRCVLDVQRSPQIVSELYKLHTATSKVHTYFIISLTGTVNPHSGHSICAYQSGGSVLGSGHLYLFDPNWGEFKVKSAEVFEFYETLIEWYDTHQDFGPITRIEAFKVK